MLNKNIQSLGGQATAKIQREQALDRYYKNPKICLHCNKVITVPDNRTCGEVKQKKFCNRSCSSSFNNKNINRHKNIQKSPKIKKIRKKILEGRTKGYLFTNYSTWQNARSTIQKHARKVYKLSNRPKECYKCGYNTHYEVCHKKPVSLFDNNASIVNEINNIENLVALCPTHHWEFDNNILKIE